MTEDILSEVRGCSGFRNAIMGKVELVSAQSVVTVQLITDLPYSQEDFNSAYTVIRKYIPECFSFELQVSKLTPDGAMVKRRIMELIAEKSPALSSVIGEADVSVQKTDTALGGPRSESMVRAVEEGLKKTYCGEFRGFVSKNRIDAESITVEEKVTEESFEAPVRTFPIENFSPIESADAPKRAIYMADFNFVSENAVICGSVIDITERSYTRSNGEEKPYFALAVSDGTSTLRVTYFARKKSVDKIREIKAGESIVLNCRSDVHNGSRKLCARKAQGAPRTQGLPHRVPRTV